MLSTIIVGVSLLHASPMNYAYFTWVYWALWLPNYYVNVRTRVFDVTPTVISRLNTSQCSQCHVNKISICLHLDCIAKLPEKIRMFRLLLRSRFKWFRRSLHRGLFYLRRLRCKCWECEKLWLVLHSSSMLECFFPLLMCRLYWDVSGNIIFPVWPMGLEFR